MLGAGDGVLAGEGVALGGEGLAGEGVVLGGEVLGGEGVVLGGERVLLGGEGMVRLCFGASGRTNGPF